MENPIPKTAGYQVLSYLYFRYLKCLVNSGGKIPDSEEPLKKSMGASTWIEWFFVSLKTFNSETDTLRIQVCPKKGINPISLLWGWDWDHQT